MSPYVGNLAGTLVGSRECKIIAGKGCGENVEYFSADSLCGGWLGMSAWTEPKCKRKVVQDSAHFPGV